MLARRERCMLLHGNADSMHRCASGAPAAPSGIVCLLVLCLDVKLNTGCLLLTFPPRSASDSELSAFAAGPATAALPAVPSALTSGCTPCTASALEPPELSSGLTSAADPSSAGMLYKASSTACAADSSAAFKRWCDQAGSVSKAYALQEHGCLPPLPL